MNRKKIKLSAIVAGAENQVIGKNNTLPWHIPEDLKYFKQTTMGKPMIMGRLTFESFGKPLPGRPHIVVTRQRHWSYEGVRCAHSLEKAIEIGLEQASELGSDEVMIVGGANIYRQVLSQLDLLYFTEVHQEFEGDAWFPELDAAVWKETKREGPFISDKNGLAFSFVIFQKQ